MSLEICRKKILAMFGMQDVIKYSIDGFKGDWNQLMDLVEAWWSLYKKWESDDTLAAAFLEQRLTVKGTALTWKMDLEAYPDTGADNTAKFPVVGVKPLNKMEARWLGQNAQTQYYPMVKGLRGILDRLNPEVFVPKVGHASLKTEQGLHDQSAGLMQKGKPISEQQYKTPEKDQCFVFMPLSHAGDQAVYHYINTVAKANRKENEKFYNLVRDIRSKMTRVKLAAEHDMATNFACVGKTSAGRPKFAFTLGKKTDVSTRDKEKKVIGDDVIFPKDKKIVQTATTEGILQARRLAAINFQSLVLGEMHCYGEVVVAYRQHAGKFPKFAQFNSANKLWRVGELTQNNTWKFKNPLPRRLQTNRANGFSSRSSNILVLGPCFFWFSLAGMFRPCLTLTSRLKKLARTPVHEL